jgi:hypothetical protein
VRFERAGLAMPDTNVKSCGIPTAIEHRVGDKSVGKAGRAADGARRGSDGPNNVEWLRLSCEQSWRSFEERAKPLPRHEANAELHDHVQREGFDQEQGPPSSHARSRT